MNLSRGKLPLQIHGKLSTTRVSSSSLSNSTSVTGLSSEPLTEKSLALSLIGTKNPSQLSANGFARRKEDMRHAARTRGKQHTLKCLACDKQFQREVLLRRHYNAEISRSNPSSAQYVVSCSDSSHRTTIMFESSTVGCVRGSVNSSNSGCISPKIGTQSDTSTANKPVLALQAEARSPGMLTRLYLPEMTLMKKAIWIRMGAITRIHVRKYIRYHVAALV